MEHLNDVEEGCIQRFAARMLDILKTMGILCAVDTAIFKKEIGYVRLLEADITSFGSQSEVGRALLKDRVNDLLSMVIDRRENTLDQTKEGTAWILKTVSSENIG